jgi:hypothetical protein
MLTRSRNAEPSVDNVLSRCYALILSHSEEPAGTFKTMNEVLRETNALRRMRKAELLALAQERGHKVTAALTKDQIIRLLNGEKERK